MGNWIKISRDLRKHWIFSDAEYLKWWFDILCEASWEDNRQLVGARLIMLKRGQFVASLSYLCDRWHRSRSKVEPFLRMLIEEGMITKTVTHNISILTVVNYNQYQDTDNTYLCASVNECISKKCNDNNQQTDAYLCTHLDAYLESAKVQKADAYSYTSISQTKSDTYNNEIPQTNAYLDAHLCTHLDATNKEYKEEYIDNNKRKNKEKENELEQSFEEFRQKYPGRKRGHDTEFEAFKRKHQKWADIVPKLMPALERLIAYNNAAKEAGQFVPCYAHLSTWLHQARWEEELPAIISIKQSQQSGCNYDDEDAAFVSKNK